MMQLKEQSMMFETNIIYFCKLVTIDHMEASSIEHEIDSIVDITPVPVVALVVLGQALTSNKLPLKCE